MRRVGNLIGIDADEAGFHPGVEPLQIVLIPGRTVSAECGPHDRRGVAEEALRPAHLHLDQQRLAFMHAHAQRIADRLAAPGFRQAAFIKRMAGFMQHPHQTGGEIGLVIARGDADIVRRAAAKRVQADVEPPVVEIKTQRLHELDAQGLLGLLRERAFGGDSLGLCRLRLEDLA